jgi:transcription antitermination factor NusG
MPDLTSRSNNAAFNRSPVGPAPIATVVLHPMAHPIWFAVYTRSHHEKSVARQLLQKGIEHYLPLYQSRHVWTNGRRVVLDLPLFPNYLFVNILPTERSRVLSTEGVVMFVDRGNVVNPVLDSEIEQLRAELRLRKFEPHPNIAVGQLGRIVSGPLAGLKGILLRRKGDLRVVLTAPLINQCVAVEVNADEIVPAEISC